jgi:hypothetical protein
MKVLLFLLLTGVAGSFAACGHSNPPDQGPAKDSVSNPYFPVADYLESEILNVDSTPIALCKYVTHKGRTDSSFIGVAEFNSLALEFLPPSIRDSAWERHFTESSFSDKTTGSITFMYSSRDTGQGVQRVDVLTAPGRRAQEVRTVYVEQSRRSGDSLILRKMLWRSKIGFQIMTIARVKGQDMDEQQVKVIWGSEKDIE